MATFACPKKLSGSGVLRSEVLKNDADCKSGKAKGHDQNSHHVQEP
jgi:hypothetical protein